MNMKTAEKKQQFRKQLGRMIYFTAPLPQKLLEQSSIIQDLPFFTVRKSTQLRGVIIRVPKSLKVNQICHVFIELEVNLTNTLKSGKFTPKVQITFVPVQCGEFDGFEKLDGEYKYDEDDIFEDWFVPDYSSAENIERIKPLRPIPAKKVFDQLQNLYFDYEGDVIQATTLRLCSGWQSFARKVIFTFDEENDCIKPPEEKDIIPGFDFGDSNAG